MLKKLKNDDLGVIKEHIGFVKAAAQKKKDVLDGKFEELGEFLTHPRKEAEQLSKVIKDIEKIAGSDLLATLLALEVDTRELMRSIEEELKLIKGIEKVKTTKKKSIEKEIEGEIILATIIEHQLSLLVDLKSLTRASINKSNEIRNAKKRAEVGKNSVNLNNIANFLGRVIFDEEIPNLAIAYNMLKLEEWEKIEERIIEAKAKFFETQEHLL